jgi:hypothetical protein
MEKRKHVRSRAAAAVGLMLLAGCLFEAREAQPPDTGTGGPPPVSLRFPSDVLNALRSGLQSLTRSNYERAISETFIFSPTLEDSLDLNFIGTGVFDDWTKDVEMEVYDNLIAEASEMAVTFSNRPIINENTFVRYDVAYELTVISRAVPPDTSVYKARAYFDVRNEGGNWRLTYWDELELVEGFTSWGFLRGTIRKRLTP